MNDAESYRIAYPQEWFTDHTSEENRCRWFDPQPFELEPGTEAPATALMVFDTQRPFDDSARNLSGPDQRVISRAETTVEGFDAVVFEIEQTRPGSLPDETRISGYLIDREGRGFLVQAVITPDDREEGDSYRAVVEDVVSSLRFDVT